MTKKRRILALTLTTAALTGATATACSTTHDGTPETRTFTLPRGTETLTIDAEDTAVELVPVARTGTDIKVTRRFEAKEWNGDTGISWSQDGSTLSFRTKCSGVFVDCEASHRVEVPANLAVKVKGRDGSITARGFAKPLDINSHDGSIRIEDSTAPLSLTTHDGSIRVDGSTAPLTMSTTDGSIRASALTSSDVTANTHDGSIRLTFTDTPRQVKAESRDGSVRLAVPRTPYRITTSAKDGSVDVDVPRDDASSHTLEARTHDGSIHISATA
ncbi:DUF4097 family beta strand repeat-containing protein [Streptomyces sp. NPDC051940]|uniref:DUF4097 family beta strand repeat-containing protein n=1 Tax=Streptomyces sp. NPDC051940 TaxID=3155675 RepID=UPI003421C464